jgi:hypothetical protein
MLLEQLRTAGEGADVSGLDVPGQQRAATEAVEGAGVGAD